VQTVFNDILDAIHRGRLQPGERLSDAVLAEEFGVSRTPVREALLRLREIGVVEASANRYTRVAMVGPRETAHATMVWTALYGVLLDEVVATAPREVHAVMQNDHEHFLAAVADLDLQEIATTNLSFYSRLMALSENVPLLRGITSVVHIIRLGSFHLPNTIDFSALVSAQSILLDAVKEHDVDLAQSSLAPVRGLGAPLADLPPATEQSVS